MKPMKFLMREWDIPVGVVIFADAAVSRLTTELTDLRAQAQAILDVADDEERDLTQEELDAVNEIKAKITNKQGQIDARAALAVPAQPGGRQTRPEPRDPQNSTVPGTRGQRVAAQPRNAAELGTFGFQNLGEVAMILARAARGDEQSVNRIQNVTTTYGNEQNGADGGFLVPPDFRTEIWKKITGMQSLLSRTQQFVTSGNGITFPADETTPWDLTSGVQAYWGAEGAVKTPSKPAFEMKQLRLNKLYCLVPVSDELLEDAAGLESWLRVKAPEKMDARINTALFRGNGVGKPLGFLNSPSLITVSKELSQDAGTITADNILSIWSRFYAGSRANAVWMINQDIERQLMLLKFPDESGQNLFPLYMPPGGLSGSPYSTILGRPVVPVEPASALGTIGDISLVDWSQYMTLTKGGGIKTDVSIHLYFDQDLTAFRFVLRIAGQPIWNSGVAPENGSVSRSWAVTLETRA
jgi:HK97 family phage major capsid protein